MGNSNKKNEQKIKKKLGVPLAFFLFPPKKKCFEFIFFTLGIVFVIEKNGLDLESAE